MHSFCGPGRLYCLVLLSVGLAACGGGPHDHSGLTTGKQLYEHHCAGCHGGAGAGKFIKGAPAITRDSLEPGQITHKVQGKAGGRMPAFPDMPAAELELISGYIKTLQN